MSKIDKSLSPQPWQASVLVVEDFVKSYGKLDELLRRRTHGMGKESIRRVQFLASGVVRNLRQLQALLAAAADRPPKKRLAALMLVAAFEWMEASDEARPGVTNHAVKQAKAMLSGPEARFANAVLRKLSSLAEANAGGDSTAESLADRYSHPPWLIRRWIEQWDEASAKRLLRWNQTVPKVYAYATRLIPEVPANWIPSRWKGFYEIQDADWDRTRELLARGDAYVQDPSTRLGVELLHGRAFKTALDLCAAPGGKSIQMLDRVLVPGGRLDSVDVPGRRFERLKENLERYRREGIEQAQIASDVLELKPERLPRTAYDVVYVDVPCSNTGVIQRRPDIKWRLKENAFSELKRLQGLLLCKASSFVEVDGLLVYSTCSVDFEENRGVVNAFLAAKGDSFALVRESVSLPWETGHDGAGVFLLTRTK